MSMDTAGGPDSSVITLTHSGALRAGQIVRMNDGSFWIVGANIAKNTWILEMPPWYKRLWWRSSAWITDLLDR